MANISKPVGLQTIWANGGTRIDPGVSKVNIGWVVQLPPYEYQNWVDWRQDTFNAHVSQHGIPEWDAETEYQGNLSYTQGSNGIIYKCIATHTNKDPANPLNSTYWARAFEDYGSVAVVQNQLNTLQTNYSSLSGIGNVVAARNNLSVYSKSEGDTRYAYKGGDGSQQFLVANATLAQHAVPLGQIQSLLTTATESSPGVLQIATTGETETGTNDSKAITPLKASTVYLKKSGNLAGLANIGAARTNLGLGTAATRNDSFYLQTANNLSDLTNVPAARSNLGLTSTATQPENYFLRASQNLADLQSASAARNNLGLSTTATFPLTSLMQKSENLAGLTNVSTARNNLGLADTATIASSNFLWRSNNLSDVTNVQTARNNLGLGSAATMNAFGTTGSLNFTSGWDGNAGYTFLPNGMLMQWSRTPTLRDNALGTAYFLQNFSTIMTIQATPVYIAGSPAELGCIVEDYGSNFVSVRVRRYTGNDGGTPDTIQGWVYAIGFA